MLPWKFVAGTVLASFALSLAPDPGRAAAVPALQSGEVAFARSSSSLSVPIEPVDLGSNLLLTSVRGSFDEPAKGAFACRLTATSVECERFGTGVLTLSYQVIDLSHLGASIQRGTTPWDEDASATQVPIDPVDVRRSFVVMNGFRKGGKTWAADDFITAELAADTLTFETHDQAGEDGNLVSWQVVEIPGASVQHGTAELGSSQTHVSAQIAPVHPARSLMLFSYAVERGRDAAIGQKLIDGTLSTTMATFERMAAGAAASIDYQVIEFPAGVAVTATELAFASADSSASFPAAEGSITLTGNQTTLGTGLGMSNKSNGDNPGIASFTATAAGGLLTVARGTLGSPARVTLYTVQTLVDDVTPPDVTLRDPGPGATHVEPTQPVSIHLTDDFSGVDPQSIVLMLNGEVVGAEITPTLHGVTVQHQGHLGHARQVEVSLAFADLDGNARVEGYSFTTRSLDPTPPSFLSVTASPASRFLALAWETDDISRAQVTIAGQEHVFDEPSSVHGLTVRGLDPATPYPYSIRACNGDGVCDSHAGSASTLSVLMNPLHHRYFAGDAIVDTAVTIVGEDVLINGAPVYEGVSWNGASIEGLLLNSRMVNGIYDDMDGDVPSGMQPWDPTANTLDFVSNMPAWHQKGLSAIGINLQGGSNPCNSISGLNQHGDVDNNPFGSSGTKAFDDWKAGIASPQARYLDRLGSVISAADDLGMVVILGLFYFGQDEGLQHEAAVIAGVDAATDWILANRWTNVLVEIANESDNRYHHAILDRPRVYDLVQRVQTRSVAGHLPAGRLLASVSFGGGYVPPAADSYWERADFVLPHGNSQSASDITRMIDRIRDTSSTPRPIIFNEDSTRIANFEAAVEDGAAWGFHDAEGYQCVFDGSVEDRWTLAKTSRPAWWTLLEEMTGGFPLQAIGIDLRQLQVSPYQLTEDVDEGGSVEATFSVAMADGANVPCSATTDASWLTIAPGSGVTPDVVTLTLDAAALAAGSYDAIVKVTAAGVADVDVQVHFEVDASRTHYLQVSGASNRSASTPLDGAVVAGDIYLHLAPDEPIDRVDFYLNDTSTSGSPDKVEKTGPYDFVGTGRNDTALPYDSTDLPDGVHTLSAEVYFSDGDTDVIHATFTVENDGTP